MKNGKYSHFVFKPTLLPKFGWAAEYAKTELVLGLPYRKLVSLCVVCVDEGQEIPINILNPRARFKCLRRLHFSRVHCVRDSFFSSLIKGQKNIYT